MDEPGHLKIARQLRALAERIEREQVPRGSVGRLFGLLKAIENLLGAAGGEAAAMLGEPPPAASSGSASAGPASAAGGAAPSSAAQGIARVWSDGSCAPNPGPGGWAAIVEQEGAREELSGSSRASTNNIMEMTAAIEGLRRVPPGTAVVLASDSRYLVDGMTRWLQRWKRKGWRKADGEPVLNRELWQALDELARARRVSWEWVESHAGHPENERCDWLANAARERVMAGRRR